MQRRRFLQSALALGLGASSAAHADPRATFALGHLMDGERAPNRRAGHQAVRLGLDHAGGRVKLTRLLDGAEFPRVLPQAVGERHRRLALLSSHARNDALVLDTVNVVDVDGGRVDSWRFGPGWRAEEHVLVARADGRGGRCLAAGRGAGYAGRRQRTDGIRCGPGQRRPGRAGAFALSRPALFSW